MAAESCTDDEFIALFKAHGPTETAKRLGIADRNVLKRRRNIEKKRDTTIESPIGPGGGPANAVERDYPFRIPLKVMDGTVVIFSDAHYWPGESTTAHKGLVKVCKGLGNDLKALIANGDIFDGASISRHPPIGWARPPKVKEEIEAVDERLGELRDVISSKNTPLLWMLGNHDMRFENRLAERAGEFEGVKGYALKDHFPHWTFGISLWVNDGELVVKHRFKGGVHATHNNTLNAGKSMATGHLHSLKVTPFSDYNGTRWGIDSGTLSEPYGEHAAYGEDNPLNHRSGFVVLSFRGGKLLTPEVVRVVDAHHLDFRGQLIKV